MNNNQECAIFVSSCDAFEDVWEAFFTLFFRYWPDCLFPVYLITENKIYQGDRVKTIAVGEDRKWAANFRRALNNNWHPYLIYFQEDYLLKSKVDTGKILEYIEILKKESAACVRLYPSPGSDKNYGGYKNLGEIDKDAKYGFSTQASIWNSEIFYNLLRDGERGWDLELKTGSERIKKISNPLLCVYKPAIDYFATAIKKGKWYYDAIKLCEREGIKIDKTKRSVESFSEYILRKLCNIPHVGRIFSFMLRKINLKTIKRRLLLLFMNLGQAELAIIKNKQKNYFNELKKDFSEIYDRIKKYDIHDFVTPHWEKLNQEFEKRALPAPAFNFLRDRVIGYTMFCSSGGNIMKAELDFLKKNYSKNELKNILMEDFAGDPPLLNYKHLTSNNTVHNFYHLAKFLKRTKTEINNFNTIVEWGGGYGNMAKIFWRFKNKPCTYIVIDTPLFSCIQWLYLSSILEKDDVHILKSREDKIMENKVNIVSLAFLENININADLFISTWALSESSKFSQEYAKKKNFFNAKHLLIAYQKSNESLPDAEYIKTILPEDASIEEISFLPKNYYAFK